LGFAKLIYRVLSEKQNNRMYLTSNLAQAASCPTSVQEVSGSNLSRDNNECHWHFSCPSPVPSAKWRCSISH